MVLHAFYLVHIFLCIYLLWMEWNKYIIVLNLATCFAPCESLLQVTESFFILHWCQKAIYKYSQSMEKSKIRKISLLFLYKSCLAIVQIDSPQWSCFPSNVEAYVWIVHSSRSQIIYSFTIILTYKYIYYFINGIKKRKSKKILNKIEDSYSSLAVLWTLT